MVHGKFEFFWHFIHPCQRPPLVFGVRCQAKGIVSMALGKAVFVAFNMKI